MLLPASLSSDLRGKTYAVVHLAELHLASPRPVPLSSPHPSLCKIYSQQKVVEGTFSAPSKEALVHSSVDHHRHERHGCAVAVEASLTGH